MSDPAPVDPGVVEALQRLVLEALIGGAPLPGGDSPLNIPDLAPALAERPIRLLRDTAARDLETALAGRVTLMDADQIRALGLAEGRDVTCLRFGRAAIHDGLASLTIDARVARVDPSDAPMLPLGGARLDFRQVDGAWVLAAPPAAFAY